MTIAYCIAAHTKPYQCRRLIQRLLDDDPECRVLLHYDQRHSRFDFDWAGGSRVRAVRERPVYWGSSQVMDLYLEMFRLAMGEGASTMVMLSGQDYPLRCVAGLELELSAYDVWSDAGPLFATDGSCHWPEGRRRYSYRWWHFDKPGTLTCRVDRVAEKLRVPLSRTEPPLPNLVRFRMDGQVWWGIRSRGPGVPIYTGSMWMNLSARAVEALLCCPNRVASFFHHVPSADEAYFHTVLRNATGLTFASSGGRYIRFADGEPHPEVLTLSNLDAIVASRAHFGRKFDEDVDSSVLDRLDVMSRSSGCHDAAVIEEKSTT
jgi:Core-2/I-Branching enzyme